MRNLAVVIVALGMCARCINAQDMFEVRRLTSDPAREGFPTWSPKGDSIIYQFSEMNDTSGRNGLWKISQDGSGAIQIFSGLAEHPKWSPDGRYVVFDADTGKNIKMIPSEGGDPLTFLPDSIHIERGGLPCWSPDATQLAFIEGSTLSLCIYDLNTGKLNSIFSKEGMAPLPGCWSNDGKYVLIALMDRQLRKSTIWKISSDGKKREQIKGHHENFYRHIVLSPDGSFLVYAALEGRYLGLYIMSSAGGKSLPLAVSSSAHNEGTSWSPDGKKISFNSTRLENADIWIMDLDIEQIKEELSL